MSQPPAQLPPPSASPPPPSPPPPAMSQPVQPSLTMPGALLQPAAKIAASANTRVRNCRAMRQRSAYTFTSAVAAARVDDLLQQLLDAVEIRLRLQLGDE